ncbi:MAG: hypothetical protein MAG458_01579 [Nitrosopumilus sp.]|nr:hypothetical protein [Nitrosopumilus sp.]
MTKKSIIISSTFVIITIIVIALYFNNTIYFDESDRYDLQNTIVLENRVTVESHSGEHLIEYNLKGKTVKKIEFNKYANTLDMVLDGKDPGQMTIKIPRSLMDNNEINQDKPYETWPRTEITEEKNSDFRLLSFVIPYDSSLLILHHKKIIDFDEDYGFALTFTPQYMTGLVRELEKFAIEVDNIALSNVPKIQDSMEISLTYADRVENEFIETHDIKNIIGNYRVMNPGPATFVLHSFINQTNEFDFYKKWAYDNLEAVPLYDKPDHFYIKYKGEVFELKFENLDLELYD